MVHETSSTFLITNPSAVQDLFHMPGLGVCKHDCLLVQVDIQPHRAKSPPHKVYMYRKMNAEDLVREEDDFCTSFLQSNPEQNSVEVNWKQFRDGTLNLAKKHIPMIRANRDLPWMTRELKQTIRQKNRWYRKFSDPRVDECGKSTPSLKKQPKKR